MASSGELGREAQSWGGGAFPAEAPTSAAHTDLTGVFGGLS